VLTVSARRSGCPGRKTLRNVVQSVDARRASTFMCPSVRQLIAISRAPFHKQMLLSTDSVRAGRESKYRYCCYPCENVRHQTVSQCSRAFSSSIVGESDHETASYTSRI
jgi:hypothetical protein